VATVRSQVPETNDASFEESPYYVSTEPPTVNPEVSLPVSLTALLCAWFLICGGTVGVLFVLAMATVLSLELIHGVIYSELLSVVHGIAIIGLVSLMVLTAGISLARRKSKLAWMAGMIAVITGLWGLLSFG
jgi:lysylphosphatidylglycerol synthetase-like protein (DUF2156 family)